MGIPQILSDRRVPVGNVIRLIDSEEIFSGACTGGKGETLLDKFGRREGRIRRYYLDERGIRRYSSHEPAAVAMIESIKKHPYLNDDIMNIINEDMGAFFSGQKSAQEVAGIIQNRVQLYVDVNG